MGQWQAAVRLRHLADGQVRHQRPAIPGTHRFAAARAVWQADMPALGQFGLWTRERFTGRRIAAKQLPSLPCAPTSRAAQTRRALDEHLVETKARMSKHNSTALDMRAEMQAAKAG